MTSEPLWINIVFDGYAPPIYLNASTCMLVQIICDPGLPTEEVSIGYFMNLCKSPFLKMC